MHKATILQFGVRLHLKIGVADQFAGVVECSSIPPISRQPGAAFFVLKNVISANSRR